MENIEINCLILIFNIFKHNKKKEIFEKYVLFWKNLLKI
jgi:hypothetical protein